MEKFKKGDRLVFQKNYMNMVPGDFIDIIENPDELGYDVTVNNIIYDVKFEFDFLSRLVESGTLKLQPSNKEGHCPKCGSNDIDYGAFEISDGGDGKYPYVCTSCGDEGYEWYDLTFSEIRSNG